MHAIFAPGSLNINVGLYGADIAAEDLAMVWLVVEWSSLYFRQGRRGAHSTPRAMG